MGALFQRFFMGRPHAFAFARHPYFSHHPHRADPAKNLPRHSLVVRKRAAVKRRYQPVRSTHYVAGFHPRHGQHHRARNSCCTGRAGGCLLVLGNGCFGHRHEIRRSPARCKIPRAYARRAHAGRSHVCAGARPRHETLGAPVCPVHGTRHTGHRLRGSGERHFDRHG